MSTTTKSTDDDDGEEKVITARRNALIQKHWHHRRRRHHRRRGMNLTPNNIASKATDVVVDEDADAENDLDVDDLITTRASDTTLSSSSSSWSPENTTNNCCSSSSWNSIITTNTNTNHTNNTTINTNHQQHDSNKAADADAAFDADVTQWHKPEEKTKKFDKKFAGGDTINNNNTTAAKATSLHHLMTTKVHACCHDLHALVTECFFWRNESTTTTDHHRSMDGYKSKVEDTLCDAIELISCADYLCYDNDDYDDDDDEVCETRKQWRFAKKKQLRQRTRMMDPHRRQNWTESKERETTTTTKKCNDEEKSPRRQLFNATWYGGNTSAAIVVLAPPPAASATAAGTTSEAKNRGSGGEAPTTVTATTPRERDGEVNKDTKVMETEVTTSYSPNDVMMMTTAMMDNHACDEAEHNGVDDHGMATTRYYSGLSSVARELLRSIADEKTLPLLLLDDDGNPPPPPSPPKSHHCTSTCHPMATVPSISQTITSAATTTRVEVVSSTTAPVTGGDERNGSNIDAMLPCGKESPVFSPPKVRRFPNMIGKVPGEDHKKETLNINCVCKSDATTVATDGDDGSGNAMKMEHANDSATSANANTPLASSSPSSLSSQQQHRLKPGCNHLMPAFLHVAQKMNGAFQSCHSGKDYVEEENGKSAEIIETTEHRNDIIGDNISMKTTRNARNNHRVPEKKEEKGVDERTNTTSNAQGSLSKSDSSCSSLPLQRRQMYRMLGKKARKRHYCRPKPLDDSPPLAISMKDGDNKDNNN